MAAIAHNIIINFFITPIILKINREIGSGTPIHYIDTVCYQVTGTYNAF